VTFEKQAVKRTLPDTLGVKIDGLRVMVIDDNATNRTILDKHLASWGCRPSGYPDALSALKALREAVETGDPFSLALVDVRMPEMDGMDLGRTIRADPLVQDTRLILLSSLGRRGDASICREIGFDAYLTKPVGQSRLFDVLVEVMSRPVSSQDGVLTPTGEEAERDTEHELITQYSIEERRKRRIRILLAEDNEINRRVAFRILDKAGYQCDTVTNGREAISAVETIRYDLVLMDCQMPEMDGFEATAAIRAKERDSATHLTIVAMTAHAMKGDRERCLAAGMDDYISKPVNPDEMFRVIDEWTGTASPRSPLRGGFASKKESTFEIEETLRRMGNDREFLKGLLEEFLDGSSERIESLRQAADAEDLEQVVREAHSLKGTAANLGAGVIREIALQIEMLGGESQLEGIPERLEQLEEEFRALRQSVATTI
jgi:CheY-like chemotaxis protein